MKRIYRLAGGILLVLLSGSLLAADVTWDGATDMSWTQPDSTSWGADSYASGDNVNFLGAGAGTITLGTGLTPASITINSSASYIFDTGSITGTGTLSKTGSGNLSIYGNYAATGDISIDSGIMYVGFNNTGSLGGGSWNGNISVASGAKLVVARTGNQTLDGVISGGGQVQKFYSGVLTMAGSNTYSGKTGIIPQTTAGGQISTASFNSINGGSPPMASSGLGRPTTVANGTIQIGSGGKRASCTLTYTGPGETTDRVLHLAFNDSARQTIAASGSGLLTLTSPLTITPSSGTSSSGMILAGTGTGELVAGLPTLPGQVWKNGNGTWTLSGSSVFLNTVYVSQGTLALNSTNAIANFETRIEGGTLHITTDDCIGDTNKLVITSGSVQIDSGLRERIGELWFGVAQQTNGVWGSLSSGAPNKSGFITGNGRLYVNVDLPDAGTLITLQ